MTHRKNFLFICGPARSGTSITADFLRSHNSIAMGRERFNWRLINEMDSFTPELFEKERFCRILDLDDSHHIRMQPYYEGLYDRFDECLYVGDKIPRLYLKYEYIKEKFPECKIIFLARDILEVASSFEKRLQNAKAIMADKPDTDPRRLWQLDKDWKKALSIWNEAMRRVHPLINDDQLFILEYDRLFVDDRLVTDLFAFIGLEPDESVLKFWESQKKNRKKLEASRRLMLDESQITYLNETSRSDLYEIIKGSS